VAQAALDYDEGVEFEHPAGRLIEENFWRAIRYGLDGRLIDLQRGEEFPAAALGDRLLAWTAPARGVLGMDLRLPELTGAQRQRRALEAGNSIETVFAAEVEEARRTYAASEVEA
jgi:carboxylate-amine ligase